MKRTTIYLDETLDLELARLARRGKRSKAELIREVLSKHITKFKDDAFELPDWVGIGSAEAAYTSKEDEALLRKLIEEDQKRIETAWQSRDDGSS